MLLETERARNNGDSTDAYENSDSIRNCYPSAVEWHSKLRGVPVETIRPISAAEFRRCFSRWPIGGSTVAANKNRVIFAMYCYSVVCALSKDDKYKVR